MSGYEMQVIIALVPRYLGPENPPVNEPLSPADERRGEVVRKYLAEIFRSTRREGVEKRAEIQRMFREISTVELSLEDIEVCVRSIAEALATMDYFQMGPWLAGPDRDDAVDVFERLQRLLPAPIPLFSSPPPDGHRHPITLRGDEIQMMLALSSYFAGPSDRRRDHFGRAEITTIEGLRDALAAASAQVHCMHDAIAGVLLTTDEARIASRMIAIHMGGELTDARLAPELARAVQHASSLIDRFVEFVRSSRTSYCG